MHVAVVCPYSFARPGGVQEHARGLARALVALGHQATLFAADLREERAGPPGLLAVSLGRSVPVPANGSIAPLALDPRMLVRLDLGLDPADVVHVHEPLLPACLAATLRAPRGVPVVGTFHAAAERSVPYLVAGRLLRPLVRRLAATTAVSPPARELATRYLPVAPRVVPNGVDVAGIASAPPDPWMASLGPTVLFVGRPERRKGFGVAVQAFAAAAGRRPAWHLVCVPASPASAPRAAGAVPGRVHLLGPVPRDRLLGLLRAADVLCVPSLGGESFGVVVVEGLAAGCAVLASDLPGYRFAGAEAALYVPPGDVGAWTRALERVMDDAELRARLRAGGPQRARAFDWSVVAPLTVEVYEGVLGGR